MTDEKKANIDPSKETVIGLKGSEQHHDLKNKSGDNADADDAAVKDDTKDADK